MSMLDWAKCEVKIACNKERGNKPEDEWDYGAACYESALKAFKSLCEDNHSGMSIGFTRNILNRLIDGKCLTPIEDTPDVWNDVSYCEDITEYQCKRMSSLFKYVYPDGRIEYYDTNRVLCCGIPRNKENQSFGCWHNGFVSKLIHKMYPITFPYIPSNGTIDVYQEEFLTDRANGDFDTMGIIYLILPDTKERVDINRYFIDSDIESGWKEISKEEYDKRKELRIK